MRTVYVLFDSLNRLALQAYGGTSVATPNFDRLAARAVTFERHYVGSMPCMPARRDIHTGRLSFPHRSWGPLEPYDNSFAEILKEQGIHTHLITDHLHYFEDGGYGYHTRFNTWEYIRGQEYDPWIADTTPPLDAFREAYSDKHYKLDKADKRFQAMVNRQVIEREEDFPGAKCFASAFDFLDRNRDGDDWLMMLECFDPHEPFHAPDRFREAYKTNYAGGALDWPHYDRVAESPDEIAEIRANYAALVAMCDEYLGRMLDYFNTHDMWKDTALVVSTDHGFLLSEHEWWGKCRMPYFEELTHIPLIVHDPRAPEAAGQRRRALTQTHDLMPTFLGLHGAPVPAEVRAMDLGPVVASAQAPGRDVALFAVYSGPLGVTDGRHALYFSPPDVTAEGLREYTLAPQHMSWPFSGEELATAELHPGFDFTRGLPLLSYAALPNAKRVPMNDGIGFADLGTTLYDLATDPHQERPYRDAVMEERLLAAAIAELVRHDTPPEVYRWYGLDHMLTSTREENHEPVR